MGYFSIELQEQVNTLMLPFLALIGLAFAVTVDPYIKKQTRRILLAVDVIELTVLVISCISNGLESARNPGYVIPRIALSVYLYIMRPAIIVLFIYLVWDNPRRRFFWIPAVINLLIYLTAFFKPWTFYISADGDFIRGPLGYTAHATSLLLLVSQLIITLTKFGRIHGTERLVPIANTVIILIGAFMDSRCQQSGTISFAEIATVFCCVFYYIWLHLQFVREHEHALMAEQRIQIMISQIQPHFLYNTLTTIQTLCLENPRKAAAITERFATYLRQLIVPLPLFALIMGTAGVSWACLAFVAGDVCAALYARSAWGRAI